MTFLMRSSCLSVWPLWRWRPSLWKACETC